jgi:hypothetical protein
MELIKKARSPSKRKDIAVSKMCDGCVINLPLEMSRLQQAMVANFMKHIVREYSDAIGPYRVVLSPRGPIKIERIIQVDEKRRDFEVDIANMVIRDEFYQLYKGASLEYYNAIKKTITQPLHVKINTLRREYEKFKTFNDNITNYIIIEKMVDGTSTLVQTYQLVLEYANEMPNCPLPEVPNAADCACKDAVEMAKYARACRNYILTYYGACAYSRRLVYYAILYNLEKAVKKFEADRGIKIPISTEHWRHAEQDYSTIEAYTKPDGTNGFRNATMKEWELQVHGVKKWFKVANNQHARKYCALYFQEVIDEVKKLFDAEKLTSEHVTKMVELNEIFKQTLDLESEEADDDGSVPESDK